MADTPLVSVVLSFRNEEEVIPELVRRLSEALRSAAVAYELVFVNDDSTDRSLEVLTDLRNKGETGIRVLNMSRRFGVSECALAGMEHARGDAVVLMDADLQDPPELLPEMITKWREGADVVYTVRASRAGEHPGKIWVTKLGYKFIRAISEINIPENAGDFKLISRRALNELLRLKDEKEPYLRGMVTWLGFKQVPVVYNRLERGAGQTHFPLFGSSGPIRMFISGLTSFSMMPLHFFLLAGIALCALSVVAMLFIPLMMLLPGCLPLWIPASLVLFFLSGVQLTGIGVLGLYLGKVFNQVRARPGYIVASSVGLEGR